MSRLVLLGLLAYIAVQCNGLSIERREVLADLDDGNLKSKSMFCKCGPNDFLQPPVSVMF
jgi:hypothetical protein